MVGFTVTTEYPTAPTVVDDDAPGETLEIIPLGAGSEVGRSCTRVKR
jgi:hypothetical protein